MMEPQGNKLGYLALGLAIFLLIILFAWFVSGRQKVVSPVPEEGIKVIFISPSPTPTLTPTPSPTPESTPKPTSKSSPTSTPTASPKQSP